MLLVFHMPDTNNHQGWKATEQFRAPLRISQQLWAFSEACKSTFLSGGQILQTSAGLRKSQFFWITCQVIHCKTRPCDEKERVRSPFHRWLTCGDSRQANWHLNRGRDRKKTGHHSRLPVPRRSGGGGSLGLVPALSNQLASHVAGLHL